MLVYFKEVVIADPVRVHLSFFVSLSSINELLNFRSYLTTCFNEKIITLSFSLLQEMYERNINDLYPNIEIAHPIFVSTKNYAA